MFSLGRRFILPLSNRLAYASDAYVNLKSSLNDLSSVLIEFERAPSGPRDQHLLDLVSCLRPETASNLTLGRCGGETDGGYVMCTNVAFKHAISIGVGSDVSWDIDLASRGVEVHAFDHTVKRLPQAHSNIHFYRIGLGRGPNCEPLSALMARSRVSKGCLLKVDIEGAEWDGLAAAEFETFPQIVMELHELSGVFANPDRIELLSRLHETHAPVHIHANNFGTLFRADSYWFADIVEVAFVRRDLFQGWKPSNALAHELDRPCDPRVPEISLAGILHR